MTFYINIYIAQNLDKIYFVGYNLICKIKGGLFDWSAPKNDLVSDYIYYYSKSHQKSSKSHRSWRHVKWKKKQKFCFSQVVGFDVNIPNLLGPFFSLVLMRKPLSCGPKWFLRPYFLLIRDMFLFRSGLRFSFRALEFRIWKCWSSYCYIGGRGVWQGGNIQC